jgi:hypothetical protein
MGFLERLGQTRLVNAFLKFLSGDGTQARARTVGRAETEIERMDSNKKLKKI